MQPGDRFVDCYSRWRDGLVVAVLDSESGPYIRGPYIPCTDTWVLIEGCLLRLRRAKHGAGYARVHSGPCVVCGATDYVESMGGPTICGPCDCGQPCVASS